jgi:dihydroorotate dehydrogenase
MYHFFRPLLFRLDPETAHQLTLYALGSTQYFPPALRLLQRISAVPDNLVQAFGLTFKNPIGLAAGYDKNGIAIPGLSALGFGHIEIGTVTPKPQPGNPRPRLFRLLEDEAVINRMGFPSRGAEFVSKKLLVSRRKVNSHHSAAIIGINLGKNKDTPLEEAANDYVDLMKSFAQMADYLTINISSPNTIGLRRLQGREMLEKLLGKLQDTSHELQVQRPILVKISPDLNDEELDEAVGVILDKSMDGIIATNTTLARDGLESKYHLESGGLSGSPLRVRSEAVLGQLVRRINGKIPIISVGGIMNPDDVKRRLDMGATLIQLYTGLVYRGPGLVKKILA